VGERNPDDSVNNFGFEDPSSDVLSGPGLEKEETGAGGVGTNSGVAELTSSFVFGGTRRIEVHEPVSRVRTTDR
jgi:hypothetical protein